MSPPGLLMAADVPVGHVVYLVEGETRLEWCERVEAGFQVGELVVEALQLPADGRQVETAGRAPSPPETAPSATSSWVFAPWMVVDIETTGFGREPKIIELSAVIMQHGRVIDRRGGLFNPGRPIDPRASSVHGIYDDDVKGRPRVDEPSGKTGKTPVQLLDAMCAEHDVAAIVAYNGLTSDLPILRRELGPRWFELEAGVGLIVDPLVIVRQVGESWRGEGRHKLSSVAERFRVLDPEPGIDPRTHSATWDAIVTGRVLWHLREVLPSEPALVRELMKTKAQRAAELPLPPASSPDKGMAPRREPEPPEPEDTLPLFSREPDCTDSGRSWHPPEYPRAMR